MSKKALILMAIVLVALACSTKAAVINSTWDGGEWGQWGNANNWNPNIVPDNDGNTFAVTIDAGAGEVVVELQQSRTVDQLDCYGEVEIGNWMPYWVELTLEDVNGLTNYGYLVIVEFEIGGNVTNTTGATLELEEMDIEEKDLYNQAGATIEVFYEVCVDGAVENAGLMVITPASGLYTDNHFNNLGEILIYGGTCRARSDEDIFDNNDTGLIKGFGTIYAEQQLRNKGQIYAYGGSLAIACDGPLTNTGTLGNRPLSSLHIKSAENVNNQGTIQVHSGGGVAFDCNLVNEPNATIEFMGGTLAVHAITQFAGATFEGFGGITGDVVIDPNGLIKLTGPTNIVGDVTISPDATLEISDGTTLVTGQTTCNGTIHMKGGRIIPQGGLSGNCNIIWEPGTYSNMADFNLDGQVNFKDFADFADTWLWQTAWH